MTYGKASKLAKEKSLKSDDNFIVYSDDKEGHIEYHVAEEDNFWFAVDVFQREEAIWSNGKSEQL